MLCRSTPWIKIHLSDTPPKKGTPQKDLASTSCSVPIAEVRIKWVHRSFHFPLPIEFFEILKSYRKFTNHCKRKCFFRLNGNVWVQYKVVHPQRVWLLPSAFWLCPQGVVVDWALKANNMYLSALGKFANLCCFNANPSRTSENKDWLSVQLQNVNGTGLAICLFFCFCLVMSVRPIMGLYTSRPNNWTFGTFLESRAQAAGDRNIFLEPKNGQFGLLKKRILLRWYVKSYTCQVFPRIPWVKGSETTDTTINGVSPD